MSVEFRQPNITASTETEQLLQMRSYLYQLAAELNWAFSTVSGMESSSIITAEGMTGYKTEAERNFAGIKDLIIKSAEIVSAVTDKVEMKLGGKYVAKGDFGTYREDTALILEENSTSIQQIFQNNREITETVNNLYDAQIGTNAYIKTGLLYEEADGSPVYGLEIGQTNDVQGHNVFTKFARFSSDRLSFYDRNDTEIAYISDYKLYITNAQITGALELAGKFKIYYQNGLAFQWIGGVNT